MAHFTKNQLLAFIYKAHKNTYAASKKVKEKYKLISPINKDHVEYLFTEGDFEYHDSYAGWRQAPGKEIVYFKKKPIWQMTYQGQVEKESSDEFVEKIYSFLHRAMMKITEELPYRGQKKFEEGDFKYSFSYEGNLEFLTGKEIISYKNKEVYFQTIMACMTK